jgi:hypothetical protein
MALCIWEHDDLYVGIPWKSNLIDHPQNHHVFWHVLAPMKKSGFRAAVAGRMTIPHMSSILWCGKAQKKLSPTGNHGWYSFYNPANGVHFTKL